MRILKNLALAVSAVLLMTPITPALAAGCYNPQPYKDLTGCSYVGIDLSGYDLSNTNLADTDLTNTNLSGANLTGVRSGGIKGTPSALPTNWVLINGYLFGPGANLYATSLQDLNLSNLNLAEAEIWGAVWTNVNLRNVNLRGANFSGARLTNLNLEYADLTDATLSYANLFNPNISDANFTNVNAYLLSARSVQGTAAHLPTDWKMAQGFLIGPGANLSSAVLNNIDFRQMKIDGASFRYAGIYDSNFNGMDLSVADFTSAIVARASIEATSLGGANLEGFCGSYLTGTPSSIPDGWTLRSGFLIGPKANLNSQNMTNVNFTGTNLAGAILAFANLTNANLSGVDLRETVIEGVNLSGANIDQANLTGVSLNQIIAPNVIGQPIGLDPNWQYLHGYLIGPGANLSSVRFQNLDLTKAKLQGVNFIYADLSGSDLTGVDLTGVNLTGVNLSGATLEGANLTNATMFELISDKIVGTPVNMPTNWRLIGGFIIGPRVNLRGANLTGLDLRNIDMTGVNLDVANLTGADLRGAKLTGGKIDGTNFTGAQLTNVITGNLTGSPTGLPKNFSFSEGTIKGTIFLSPTPKTAGLARVGAKLTAVPGSWDTGVTLSFQWLRNGITIEGANSRTYTLTPSDFRKGISVAVTGTGTGGVSKTKLSLQSPVAIGTMTAKVPTITGTVAKGKTVNVTTAAWVPGAKITYSWLLDGKAIKGATKSSYKILPTQVGKKLSVLVKQTALGYTTASKASTAVKVK